MQNELCKDESSKKQKHLQIDSELINLHSVVVQLEDFLARIQGREESGEKELSPNKLTSLCLAEFLSNSQERIDQYVLRLHEIHNGLRESLF